MLGSMDDSVTRFLNTSPSIQEEHPSFYTYDGKGLEREKSMHSQFQRQFYLQLPFETIYTRDHFDQMD